MSIHDQGCAGRQVCMREDEAPTSEAELPVVSDHKDDKCYYDDNDSEAVAGEKYWHMSVFPKLSVSDYTICQCSILLFLNIHPYLV